MAHNDVVPEFARDFCERGDEFGAGARDRHRMGDLAGAVMAIFILLARDGIGFRQTLPKRFGEKRQLLIQMRSQLACELVFRFAPGGVSLVHARNYTRGLEGVSKFALTALFSAQAIGK